MPSGEGSGEQGAMDSAAGAGVWGARSDSGPVAGVCDGVQVCVSGGVPCGHGYGPKLLAKPVPEGRVIEVRCVKAWSGKGIGRAALGRCTCGVTNGR